MASPFCPAILLPSTERKATKSRGKRYGVAIRYFMATPKVLREHFDFVPWTARPRQGVVPRGGGQVDPVEWAEKNREHAILKPFNLFGSRSVEVGHLMSDEEWRSALTNAVEDGRYVVQEVVQPDAWTMRYWDSAEDKLLTVTSPVLLGPFAVYGRDGGCFAQQPVTGWPRTCSTQARGGHSAW
jgi:hypothetical protein